MKVRPREAADRAAAQGFLARHNSLRVARLGDLVHPLDHPALVAETDDGRLLGMLTYVPGQDWQQCEILTLHAGEQWRGAGTALIEAIGGDPFHRRFHEHRRCSPPHALARRISLYPQVKRRVGKRHGRPACPGVI